MRKRHQKSVRGDPFDLWWILNLLQGLVRRKKLRKAKREHHSLKTDVCLKYIYNISNVWVSVKTFLTVVVWHKHAQRTLPVRRGFASSFSRTLPIPHPPKAVPSVSLHRCFREMHRAWSGVITNKYWGNFMKSLCWLEKTFLMFVQEKQAYEIKY